MTEYIYYAKYKGDPDWKEEIVLQMNRQLTTQETERLLQELKKKGMEFRRIHTFNWEAPDFAGTVNI